MNEWLWREIDEYNISDKNKAINNVLVWKIMRSIEWQRSPALGYGVIKQKLSTITNSIDNDLVVKKKQL